MAGRPKFNIDYGSVEKLANIMCTQQEIATFLGCDVRTLQRDDEFCRVYKKGMETGKMSLRRWQFESAKKGKVPMQIFLGKNYLGQKDVIENVDNTQMQKVEELLSKIKDEANGTNG